MHSSKSKINFFNKPTDVNRFLFLSVIFMTLVFISAYAFADTPTSFGYKFCQAVVLIKGPVGKTLCTIAILSIGVSFLMGKVQTSTLITVILGVALIYTAPNIVSLLSGGSSGTQDCTDMT